MKDEIKFQFEKYFERIAIKSHRTIHGYYKVKSSSDLKSVENLSILRIEQVIAKSILDFESKFLKDDIIIRSDAKVLLIINFTDMVYYPLTMGSKKDPGKMKREIYEEVQQILEQASKEHKEISSHNILEVGLKLWNSLKVMSNESW